MRYRKLTADGDYTFGNGQMDFYRDIPEAPSQAAMTRLLLWLGEWFLDISEGTPYFQGILGKHSESLADATIQDRILGTQGVTDITNVVSNLNPTTRKLTYTCDLSTVYGPTSLQITNYTLY